MTDLQASDLDVSLTVFDENEYRTYLLLKIIPIMTTLMWIMN